jgi:hypothetical protein
MPSEADVGRKQATTAVGERYLRVERLAGLLTSLLPDCS